MQKRKTNETTGEGDESTSRRLKKWEVRVQPMNELSAHKPSRLQHPKMDKQFHPFIQCVHDSIPGLVLWRLS